MIPTAYFAVNMQIIPVTIHSSPKACFRRSEGGPIAHPADIPPTAAPIGLSAIDALGRSGDGFP